MESVHAYDQGLFSFLYGVHHLQDCSRMRFAGRINPQYQKQKIVDSGDHLQELFYKKMNLKDVKIALQFDLVETVLKFF